MIILDWMYTKIMLIKFISIHYYFIAVLMCKISGLCSVLFRFLWNIGKLESWNLERLNLLSLFTMNRNFRKLLPIENIMKLRKEWTSESRKSCSSLILWIRIREELFFYTVVNVLRQQLNLWDYKPLYFFH